MSERDNLQTTKAERILIVRALWNDSLTKPLAAGAKTVCEQHGYHVTW